MPAIRLSASEDIIERMSDYFAEFQVPERSLMEHDEGMGLVHEFSGRITHLDEEDNTTSVGKIRGDRVDLAGAWDRQIHIYEVLDSHSQELADLYQPLFNQETGDLRDDLELEAMGSGLLAVHEISVNPKHQGWGLGLLALRQTIIEFGGGCALVVIKPFPLQYGGENPRRKDSAFPAAQRKLVDYWSRLGFTRVDDTDYFYFDLAFQLPTPEQILDRLGGR